MTVEEAQAQIAELEAQLEQARKSQAGVDKSHAEAMKKLERYGQYTPEMIEARIQRVARSYDTKVKTLELDYFVKGRCLDAGIPHEIVKDLQFADQQAAEAHIARIAKVIDDKRLDERERMLTSGQKPQAGSPPSKDEHRSFQVIEAMAKASAGIL
jgi:hypothetical protein